VDQNNQGKGSVATAGGPEYWSLHSGVRKPLFAAGGRSNESAS